jgi:hypothetical protein
MVMFFHPLQGSRVEVELELVRREPCWLWVGPALGFDYLSSLPGSRHRSTTVVCNHGCSDAPWLQPL